MDIGLIRESSVFVIIAGLTDEFLASGDESLEDTHKRVVAKMHNLMHEPQEKRLFIHERPADPAPPKMGKILTSHPELPPPGPPVTYMIHIPDGAQVQVLPGTFFKAFMREQQAQAMQAQGMVPNPRMIRG